LFFFSIIYYYSSKNQNNLPLQQVFVVGFPTIGRSLTLSEGIISQVDPRQHRFRMLSDGVTTQEGSGGPLLRKDRSFVGVVLAVDKTTGNFVEVLPNWKLMPFLEYLSGGAAVRRRYSTYEKEANKLPDLDAE